MLSLSPSQHALVVIAAAGAALMVLGVLGRMSGANDLDLLSQEQQSSLHTYRALEEILEDRAGRYLPFFKASRIQRYSAAMASIGAGFLVFGLLHSVRTRQILSVSDD